MYVIISDLNNQFDIYEKVIKLNYYLIKLEKNIGYVTYFID